MKNIAPQHKKGHAEAKPITLSAREPLAEQELLNQIIEAIGGDPFKHNTLKKDSAGNVVLNGAVVNGFQKAETKQAGSLGTLVRLTFWL